MLTQKTWVKIIQIVLIRNGLAIIGIVPILFFGFIGSFGDGNGFKINDLYIGVYVSAVFILSIFLAYLLKSKSFIDKDKYKIPLYIGLMELLVVTLKGLSAFFIIPNIFISAIYSLVANPISFGLIAVDCILGYLFIRWFLRKRK